jgi:hypothetical protein
MHRRRVPVPDAGSIGSDAFEVALAAGDYAVEANAVTLGLLLERGMWWATLDSNQ